MSGACPKCGGAKVERTRHDSGAKFTGCSRFPDCKWSQQPPAASQRGVPHYQMTSAEIDSAEVCDGSIYGGDRWDQD